MTPLSVFLQTKKPVFGARQPILTSVSTNDPCVPPETFEGSKTVFGDVLKFQPEVARFPLP